LINFSHDEIFAKQMIKFNVAIRVLDFLKDNVKIDMKVPDKTSANFIAWDKVYEIKGVS
jgi:hypothetical protein